MDAAITFILAGMILYYAWVSMSFGLFHDLVNLALLFFTMLLTLRYWHWATDLIRPLLGLPPRETAFVAYFALLAIFCLPLIGISSRITEESRPTYPHGLDRLLGFVFGAGMAAVAACCVMTAVTVVGPAFHSGYDSSGWPVAWDRIPMQTLRWVETNVAGLPPGAEGQTLLPEIDAKSDKAFEASWR